MWCWRDPRNNTETTLKTSTNLIHSPRLCPHYLGLLLPGCNHTYHHKITQVHEDVEFAFVPCKVSPSFGVFTRVIIWHMHYMSARTSRDFIRKNYMPVISLLEYLLSHCQVLGKRQAMRLTCRCDQLWLLENLHGNESRVNR